MKDQNNRPAPGKVQASERPGVSLERLLHKLAGNHEHILICLDVFKSETPPLLAVIRSGLKNRETRDAKNSCHGLRGMLLTMELHKAASMAAALETSIVEKRFEDSEALLYLLENEINTATDFIENSLKGL